MDKKSIDTESIVLIIGTVIFFTSLIWFLAYMALYEVFFPHHYTLYSGHSLYNENQYAFPGSELKIPLGERAILSHHTLSNVKVTYLGQPLVVSAHSGVVFNTDSFKNRGSLKESDNVGWIKFELPNNDDSYDQSITVSYKAKFRFPIIVDYDTFKWGSRNISGDYLIKIGSLDQERSIQIYYYAFLISALLAIVLITTYLLVFERVRLNTWLKS